MELVGSAPGVGQNLQNDLFGRDDDSDFPDDRQAVADASEEVESTPSVIVKFLLEECFEHRDPVDIYAVARRARDHETSLPPHAALAVLFGACDRDALEALRDLRESFEPYVQRLARPRAAQLIRERAQRRSDRLAA